jgi:hypothetical protein
MPPRNGYFELLDHPASTMPYTPSEAIANTNRMPTFRLAITPGIGSCERAGMTSWLPHGTTAIVISAGTIAIIGAKVK